MGREKSLVVLAGEQSDKKLWDIQPLVQGCGVAVIAVSSAEDLLEGMRTKSLRPSVIMLSPTLNGGNVSETIAQIRELDESAPVVIVASNSTRNIEREARCAGIFYYMTLPTRRDEVEQVTLWALRAGRR